MKKIFIILLICFMFLCGCGKIDDKDFIKKIKDNIKGSYSLEGSLSMTNNDDVYNYDVSVSYKKDDYYKVSLTNVSNNHTQVILKNNDGVYIVTPSLNKSFKFQSDWPYDNSQIYLLEALINDIESDSDYKFVYEDDKFIFKTKVNYPNNKMLNHQKIVFDNDMDLEKVLVFDSNDVVRMELVIKDIEYSPTFKNNYFDLNNLIKTFDEVEVVESSKIDDSIFPLFVPSGTKLQNSEIIETDVGERLIMTFDGDKPFLLVGETADVMDEFTIIPTYGEPYMLIDTLGVVTDNSLSWNSNGIDYYLVSDVMGKDELVEIARSISSIPALK